MSPYPTLRSVLPPEIYASWRRDQARRPDAYETARMTWTRQIYRLSIAMVGSSSDRFRTFHTWDTPAQQLCARYMQVATQRLSQRWGAAAAPLSHGSADSGCDQSILAAIYQADRDLWAQGLACPVVAAGSVTIPPVGSYQHLCLSHESFLPQSRQVAIPLTFPYCFTEFRFSDDPQPAYWTYAVGLCPYCDRQFMTSWQFHPAASA